MSARVHVPPVAAAGWRRRLLLAAAAVALWCCQDGARPKLLPLAKNRAYSGAPPTVPHAIEQRTRQDCLSCHLRGDATTDDGAQLAKATPHPELEHCVSCHVPTRAAGDFRPNGFRGKSYAMGLRAHPGGPWLIPHPLTLRENCLGCHDTPRTPAALRVSHPERERCLQCHLPAHEGSPGARSRAASSAAPGLVGMLVTPRSSWSTEQAR